MQFSENKAAREADEMIGARRAAWRFYSFQDPFQDPFRAPAGSSLSGSRLVDGGATKQGFDFFYISDNPLLSPLA